MQAVLSCMLKALAIPAIWRHDLGPEFTNALFEEVSILLGIQEMLSARRRRCHQAMRMRSASLPLPWPPAGWNKPGAWVSRQRSGDTLPQWGARRGKGCHLCLFFGVTCVFFFRVACVFFYCPEATVSNERPLGRTYAFTSAYT